ncbi:MAG: hypothetical protein EOM22_06910 [Gammaproteobacteria bacterium]|nr:hypothetical protein [Gammaproteobacteria bacterium]
MIYMTTEHKTPDRHILHSGHFHPVAPLIRREDIHRLASLGVLRHITAEGPAPLGYAPWQLAEDAQGPHYWREPAGTAEERQAAIDAQAAAARDAYLDGLECTRLQGKLALIQAGLWGQYEALIATMLPTMTAAQRVFVEDAQVWKLRDPVLQAFAASLEMTEAQTVGLFELARTL